MKEFLKSKTFVGIASGLGALFVALLVFQAGIIVGSHKAQYSYGLGDNFFRGFGREKSPMMGGDPVMRGDFVGAHGTVGKIVKIDSSKIIVADRENVEKTIITNQNTIIRESRDDIELSDLSVGDTIIVLGTPNDTGDVVASLIRIMPDPSIFNYRMPGIGKRNI